jgi:hypothetical protein
MSESNTPSLQFDRAELPGTVPQHVVCGSCNQDVRQAYYTIGRRIYCNHCRETRDQDHDGLGLGRFLRAAVAGLGVAVAGAAVWWAVRTFMKLEIGIISIFIGIGVAKAVMWGSHGKGGWLYQLLAVFLTYTAVALNYMPDIAAGLLEGNPGAPAIIVYPFAAVLGYIVPFQEPLENILGLLIIAFGLFQAWVLTKRTDDTVSGPFTVTPSAIAPPVANV